jgi:cytochrome c oxidase cbb3-type subunit 3
VWAHGVLRESVRKLPLWWLLMSIAAFIAAVTYFALYPGLGNFKGSLGWTQEGQFQRDTAANNAKIEAQIQPFRASTIEQMAVDAKIVANGQTLFLDNCAACHGAQAMGNSTLGAPNLIDADWLYGESSETLLTSIRDGRGGTMPALGGVLGHDGLNEVVAYVMSLGGVKAPADWVAAGKTRFETICAACHGADGRGNPTIGAPNLTDKIWLYGGDLNSVYASVREGRNGVMPGWRSRLTEDQLRLIAAWVYAQGHREPLTKR